MFPRNPTDIQIREALSFSDLMSDIELTTSQFLALISTMIRYEITIEAVHSAQTTRFCCQNAAHLALTLVFIMSRFSNIVLKQLSLFSTVFFCMRAFNLSTWTPSRSTGITLLCFLLQESILTTNSSQMAHFDSEFSASWEGDKRSQALSMHISSIRQATNWNLDLWRNIYAFPKYLRSCRILGGSKSTSEKLQFRERFVPNFRSAPVEDDQRTRLSAY